MKIIEAYEQNGKITVSVNLDPAKDKDGQPGDVATFEWPAKRDGLDRVAYLERIRKEAKALASAELVKRAPKPARVSLGWKNEEL